MQVDVLEKEYIKFKTKQEYNFEKVDQLEYVDLNHNQ